MRAATSALGLPPVDGRVGECSEEKMAEYYPLLAKAIAGLPNSTPETRRAVYERARKALLAQLQNLEPPLAAADVARESDALAGAVARLEAELAGLDGYGAERPRPNPPVAPAPAPKAPGRPAPPPAKLAARQSPAAAELANQDARIPRETRPLKAPERPVQKTRAANAVAKDAEAATGGAIWPEPIDSFDDESLMELPKPRAEGQRLYAPQPQADEGRGIFRLWIVGGVVALVVVIVAVAAWTLRDRPDQLAKLTLAPAQPKESGKIVERIGGGPKEQENPSSTTAEVAPTAPVAPANPPLQPSDAGQTIPVAQRAALLVEAPDAPNKVKTYVGTVVWRLDNVSNGPGQPLGTAVHADIDIPADKLKVALTLQKNVDASLPASHTLTIVFTVQPDSPTGGVKQISVPQLREDDTPTGETLIGVPVPIMDNSFLIGLTRGSAEATNLRLIQQRAWFDIPILLGNGRIAKLTFEKSASGTRAINDAIAAWQSQ